MTITFLRHHNNTWTFDDGPITYTVWWCPSPIFDQDRARQASWYLTVQLWEKSTQLSLGLHDRFNAALALTLAKHRIQRLQVLAEAQAIVSEAWVEETP